LTNEALILAILAKKFENPFSFAINHKNRNKTNRKCMGYFMSLEENKAIVRKSIEIISTHDLSSIENIVSSNFVDHTRQIHGLEGMKQFLFMVFKSFPDFHINIEDIIAEGDKVWVRLTITASHTGEFNGLPPTGKKFKEASIWINRIGNGKLVEGWDVQDELDFYKKIGAIAYTEKGKNLFSEDVS
jgi:C-1 hydroxylase